MKKRKYDLLSVKTMLEKYYAIGHTSVDLNEFLDTFSQAYNLDIDKERRKILQMLSVWERSGKIRIENEKICLWNMFTSNLRLIINN